jgi:hypothetical protein
MTATRKSGSVSKTQILKAKVVLDRLLGGQEAAAPRSTRT